MSDEKLTVSIQFNGEKWYLTQNGLSTLDYLANEFASKNKANKALSKAKKFMTDNMKLAALHANIA